MNPMETIGQADDLTNKNRIRQIPVVGGKRLVGSPGRGAAELSVCLRRPQELAPTLLPRLPESRPQKLFTGPHELVQRCFRI
jgi:hypothetical protein